MSVVAAAALKPQHSAAPRRGFVLSTAVEELAVPLRRAVASLTHSAIEPEVRSALALPLAVAGPRWSEREAWLGLGLELVTATYTSDDKALSLVRSPSLSLVVSQHLADVIDDPRVGELLPYLLDAHGPGSRLSVRKDPGTAGSRAKKKASGVFYTPPDVASYMVDTVLEEKVRHRPPTFLDPAVGTGVFLRAALRALKAHYPSHPSFEIARQFLFGTDIDERALDGAALVLLHDSDWCGDALAGWRLLRENLVNIDGLTLSLSDEAGSVALGSLFPALAEGADIVIGNPPYASVGERQDAEATAARFRTLHNPIRPGDDLYPVFVEQIVRLGSVDGSGAMVVPLSLATNGGFQFQSARTLIGQTRSLWRFAFFDREPHALFGEDVKTRCTILFRNATQSATPIVQTGPLRRWRGDDRAAMFGSLGFTTIDANIGPGIPKVWGAVQEEARKTLEGQAALGSLILNVGRTSLAELPIAHRTEVLVGPTAYNFLNVARVTVLPLTAGETLSENPLIRLMALDDETAAATYACLSSKLAFWWWLVHGDGFHVNQSTLLSLPIGRPAIARLAELGTELWKVARRSPVRSSNRGRVTFSYPAPPEIERSEIDAELRRSLGLSDDFAISLDTFVATVVDAKLFTSPHNWE